MPGLKFLHAADIHLGRQFTGLQRSSPELGDLFRRAGYSAWEKIVQAAVDNNVDFVTLAGDVFDAVHPTVRARVTFMRGIQRLYAEGIPVFMALGNHDPLRTFPNALRSLPGLHLFGPDPETRGSGAVEQVEGVMLFGASYEKSVVTENLAKRFKRDKGMDVAIGVLHANVFGYSAHKDYAPCTLDDLREAQMDAWCLGHVHSSQILWQDPLILYAGTSQGAHAAECGARGCYLVQVNERAGSSAEFIPLAPVRWELIQLDATGLSSPERLLEVAEEKCLELALEGQDLEAVVVRISVTGVGSKSLSDSMRPDGEIHELLAERLSELPVPVFPESLRDLTSSGFDLESLKEEEGFLGEFLRLCGRSADDPDSVRELTTEIQTDLLRRVGRTYILPEAEPAQLLEDSSVLADRLHAAAEEVASTFFELAPDRER